MGKASRVRRQKKEQERQRRRAASAAGAARGADAPGAPGPQGWPGWPGWPGPRQFAASDQRELAGAAISDAVSALCEGQRDDYGGYLDVLCAGGERGWTRAVSRCLVEYLRSSVTRAWRGGWQPAEVTRHVGRELSAAHAAVASAMIIEEMRGYAVSAVDDRWAAQVAALDGGVPGEGAWWGSDAEFLTAWHERGRGGEFRDTVAVVLETLHAFSHFPVLEALLPLPGEARRVVREPAAAPVDDRMLGRIRALLAKAESTEYAEEAEALSARAQELMAKYSIDRALLAAEAGRKEVPGGRRIAVDNPYEGPKASLLQTVALANRCRTVWLRDLGLVMVIGFPADLDVVELLFTSLLVQAGTAMLRAGAKRDSYGRSRTRAFRQSFLVSYAIRIGERLAEAASQAEREVVAERQAAAGSGAGAAQAVTGTELVPFLAARRQAVDDAVGEMFGDGLVSHKAARVTDLEGWTSGRAAADMASLHARTPVGDS